MTSYIDLKIYVIITVRTIIRYISEGIYRQVWTTNQEMKRRRHNGGPIINTNPNPDDASGNINRTTAAGGSNLSIASSGSSNNPTTGVTSAPDVTSPSRNPNGSILNGSRASSIVTLQACAVLCTTLNQLTYIT